jgi:hypothetical protein
MTGAPFRFRDAVRLNCPTGVSATTLREFREVVEHTDPGVLHHHLREVPLRFTFTFWDYPNDFAIWAANALENRALAERLAVLDPFHERDIEVLRERVLDAVEGSLGDASGTLPVPPGQEFHFSSSVSVELDLGVEARNVGELISRLKEVPATSLYYHLFEGRLRTEGGWDDISLWLLESGFPRAAERLRDLDIYMASLESCRRVVIELLARDAR